MQQLQNIACYTKAAVKEDCAATYVNLQAARFPNLAIQLGDF